ncbi:MAG: aspartate-semialdehyde dehydrogenase [Bryobacteraceae bacterium]
MQTRIEVGILGATGMVGQHFIKFLQGHPWFDLTWLGASDRSAGKKYKDAMTWHLPGSVPETVADLTVQDSQPGNAPRLLFSAMDASVATEIERAFAQAGHVVVSNSKNHRMESDVPLLVPEINPDHLKLVPVQQRARGWKGQIVTNPNCSTAGLTMGLAPLVQFGIAKVIVTTMQAISGAGYPGVPSMDIMGNVIPFIGGEEGKMEVETQKILGTFRGDRIEPLAAAVSAHCNRVPVVDGHTETVSVAFSSKPSEQDLRRAISTFSGLPQQRKLPSAPAEPVIYLEENNRPQPRKDADRGRGMTASIGRLRPCPVLDWKFVVLSHNTIRGAAGAAVLNAELMHSEGMLDR